MIAEPSYSLLQRREVAIQMSLPGDIPVEAHFLLGRVGVPLEKIAAGKPSDPPKNSSVRYSSLFETSFHPNMSN